MGQHPTTDKRDFDKKLDPVKKAWFKQPGETAKAFEAFMVFLMLGKDRTLGDTAKSLGKSYTAIARWSRQWHWAIRAGAYEEHYMLLRLESAEADRDAMYVKQRSMANSALDLVGAKMAAMLDAVVEGKLDSDVLKSDAMVRLFDTASKIERMAVLGRISTQEKSAEEQERLEERYAEELASFTRELFNKIALTPEQEKKAKKAMAKLLAVPE